MAKKTKSAPVKASVVIDEKILNQIREIRKTQSNLQIEIGALSVKKHLILHQLHEVGENLQNIMKSLEEQHGKGTLNLDTGEIKLDSE
ncbi:MAG: hypothetical protein GOVbin3171_45 [Prokaryotic dsDNA virus sp.]|nr:MAG: hypothetical protein GOVbin3171_45 [Prokaryotic dsDNA virus sp.]|tara:strand:- start:293 stop:556 length:264 start_codon:yes stop_codon:yes gene_type:complete